MSITHITTIAPLVVYQKTCCLTQQYNAKLYGSSLFMKENKM